MSAIVDFGKCALCGKAFPLRNGLCRYDYQKAICDFKRGWSPLEVAGFDVSLAKLLAVTFKEMLEEEKEEEKKRMV